MSKSPGHRKWPDHKVLEQRLADRLQAEAGGEILAESADVVKVEEDESPVRFYFPRSDIREDALLPSATTTECPFKGTARYFNVRTNGDVIEDAAWSYEEPYDEHTALQDRVAFHDEKGIAIRSGAQT